MVQTYTNQYKAALADLLQQNYPKWLNLEAFEQNCEDPRIVGCKGTGGSGIGAKSKKL